MPPATSLVITARIAGEALQEAICGDLAVKAFRANPFATRKVAKAQLLHYFRKQAEADCWELAGGMPVFTAMLSKVIHLLPSEPLQLPHPVLRGSTPTWLPPAAQDARLCCCLEFLATAADPDSGYQQAHNRQSEDKAGAGALVPSDCGQ